MIVRILHTVVVEIFPPAPTEVALVSGTELGRPVGQKLELPFHRQGIPRDKGVVIESLTRHLHHHVGA